MPNTTDILYSNGNPVPIIENAPRSIDILGRQKIVSQLSSLLDIISSTKGSCTFAINGLWGSGKSFVLDMLEQQLCDYQAGEKYIVFHYNCWKYDYYEEPLVAIVTAMFDGLDENTRLIPQSARDKLAAVLPTIVKTLTSIAAPIVKSKLGLDALDLSTIPDILLSNGESQYDQYYTFNKAICKVKKELEKLSEDKTIVVVVDELDRCLPDYAIKVLERLHHLFDKLPNTAVALAIDRGQLENAVRQIFGAKTDTSKYLKKFINFEFSLDNGEITGNFSEKYADYVSLFDNIIDVDDVTFSMDEFFSALFDGIDIRTQEQMVSQLTTVHRMLFPSAKKDYCLMYLELLWIVHSAAKTRSFPLVGFNNLEQKIAVANSFGNKFSRYVDENWFAGRIREFFPQSRPTFSIPFPPSIPEVIVYSTSRTCLPAAATYVISSHRPEQLAQLDGIIEDFKKICDLLKIIK